MVVHIFSSFFFFLFEGTGKGELLVNNEHMHEYTVNVLGVPDFASHLVSGHWRWCPKWSGPEMFWQKIFFFFLNNINQLDGLETNLKFCTVVCFLSTTMQIRIAEDFEAFCILDCRTVQQSTLFCSPQVEKKKEIKKEVPFFWLNLYWGLDFS